MANKSVVYDYVENASKEAKELIAKFELEGDQEMLVKALVAAYCRGVDAVDGYLRNSLSAYRASVKSQQWISVKERLPEIGAHVLTYDEYTTDIIVAWRDECDELLGMYDWVTEDGFLLRQVTHWMVLPTPPKEEK
jgi:hypothetical protein